MLEIVTALVVVMAAAAAILLPASWLLGIMFTAEPPSASEWLRVIVPIDARADSLGNVAAAAGSSIFTVSPWSSAFLASVIRGTLLVVSLISALFVSAWTCFLIALALYVFFGV
jgi:hypothetical protein